MVKVKKERRESEAPEDGEQEDHQSWEEKTQYLSVIAKPLATKKLTKRLFKTIKKATKQKNYLRKGVREVQKFIRKGEKGIVVIAGDVSPVDVISHIPVLCEESNIHYCYTPSKECLAHQNIWKLKHFPLRMRIAYTPQYLEIKAFPFEDENSLQELGGACGTKRHTCMVMIKSHEDFEDNFNECVSGIKDLPKLY